MVTVCKLNSATRDVIIKYSNIYMYILLTKKLGNMIVNLQWYTKLTRSYKQFINHK